MQDHKGTRMLPEAYRGGREHSYIKHQLLEHYLETLFLIVGMGAEQLGIRELAYVDCCAGPWGVEGDALDSTSIAISLRVLARCRQTLLQQGRNLRFRALYIEKEPEPFARLKRYLIERKHDGIEAESLQGDFTDLRPAILEWGQSDSFIFFFIDPTQWTPVSVEVLRPLLGRPNSEFLINFMYDFISRAASMIGTQPAIEQLLGESPNVGDLHGLKREKALLDLYRLNLKKLMPGTKQWPARSAYVRVLDPEKNRPKYHLVYLTSHPRGIVEFMEISGKLDLVQKRVRAETHQQRRADKTKTKELFASDDLVDDEEGHVDIEQVERFWMDRLSGEPQRIWFAEFAAMLEKTDWFPNDFQRALKSLIGAKLVRNLDAPRSWLRPKRPLHYEDGERLQLIKDGK
jgi:three-Cys-motif partner protein